MFYALYRKHVWSAKDDILSGLTVALALVPEAVAFAFVAGVHPLVGLYAAFMVGLITSLIMQKNKALGHELLMHLSPR